MMNLPPDFVSIITNTFGEEGEALLSNLPSLIDEASARWGLTDVQPVPMLSYNFVAFAKRASTALPSSRSAQRDSNVVLKIGVPRDELTSEMAALRLFNGDGACRLIDADEQKGFLLLERLTPGEMLATLKDDEQATHIAAEVMKKIWRPLVFLESTSLLGNVKGQATALQKFIKLSDWFDGLKHLRKTFHGGTGPLDEKIVQRVESWVRDAFVENHHPVLMHGDFHHYNILSSERGWLIIDPKGVIGPAGYEVGPFLINPWGELTKMKDLPQITKRRIDILHDHLGFERERIHGWGLAHAVLSAWWSIEDNTGWEYAGAFSKMMADLPLK